MRRLGLSIVVLAVAVSGAPAGAHHRPLCPSSAPARTETLVLDSAALGSQTAVCVLLPESYEDDPQRRFPVLFLLHGAGDDQGSWLDRTDVEGLTHGEDLIVVMPDAGGQHGPAGWYSDWRDGPAWESYHIGELVPLVDATYRTSGTREGRAVAGLSMGGFGAMAYAARHPHLFVAAASFSGAVNNADGSVAQAAAYRLAQPYVGTPDDRVWGDYVTDEVRWRDHNPPDLAPNLRWTTLSLATGNGVPQPGDGPTGVPVEAGVYPLNVTFHERLVDEGIDHRWHDRGHGTHEWHYWEQDLSEALPLIVDAFAEPPARPNAFDFRTARRAFEAWDWGFTVHRDVEEFLDLRGVSADGLTVRGSGTVDVVTAPVFEPGRTYRVTGAPESAVVASDGGRLAFTVDLGASHSEQQYTVEGRVAEASAAGSYWTTVSVEISEH